MGVPLILDDCNNEYKSFKWGGISASSARRKLKPAREENLSFKGIPMKNKTRLSLKPLPVTTIGTTSIAEPIEMSPPNIMREAYLDNLKVTRGHMLEIKANGSCEKDNPENWYDFFGRNCAWYGQDENCQHFGSNYKNFGKTALQACVSALFPIFFDCNVFYSSSLSPHTLFLFIPLVCLWRWRCPRR